MLLRKRARKPRSKPLSNLASWFLQRLLVKNEVTCEGDQGPWPADLQTRSDVAGVLAQNLGRGIRDRLTALFGRLAGEKV